MCTCAPSKNHVKLVNNCYPVGNDEGPRHSELAYLSYYASSRPAKLLKVSAYLEKCLLRDLSKKRWSEVIVALKIFRHLAAACEKDLNLFAKNAIRVTEKCLSEEEVLWYAGSMFHDFCFHFDATTIGVDEDLTIHMDCLVTKFCEMACYVEKEREKDILHHRTLGLYGIYSILVSPLIKTTHARAYYTKLAYGILTNILHPFVPQTSLEEDIDWESLINLEYSEKCLEQSQINAIALKCLQQLLESSTPLNMFLVVDSTFSYIEKHQLFENPTYSVDLVLFMMSTVTQTYRHVVINEVLRLLNDCPSGRADRKQVTLVKVIENSLRVLPCVGISILEYVSSLVDRLINVYRNDEATAASIEFSSIEVELKRGLVSAISNLGSHLYYLEQTNDILAFMINKLRSIHDEAITSTHPFELDLLKCMSALVKTPDSRSNVPLPIITPTLTFLTNNNSTIRTEYTQFLCGSLKPVQHPVGHSHSSSTTSPQLDQETNLRFRSALHKRLLTYGQRGDLTVSDYNNIFAIFQKLIDRELNDELIRALPVLFYLHQSAADRAMVDQFLSGYLGHAGDVLRIGRLSEYANQVIHVRKSNGLWVGEASHPTTSHSQDQYVSPEKVQEILVQDKQLRTLFPDLSERLRVTYDPSSTDVLHLIYSGSPRVLLASKAEQPKLSIPITKTLDVRPASQRKSPQVEQFKDALKVNCTLSVCEYDSDSSDLLTGSYTTVKRSKGSRTDINNLLNSISAHSLISVTSLVETPYLSAPTSSAVI